MAVVPAWNAWMGTLVPERMRTPYFAQRHRLGHFGAFVGFVIGGLVLQFYEARGATLTAFAALFAIAGICRLLSTACLCACREPKPPGHGEEPAAAGRTASLRHLPARLAATVRGMAVRPSGTLVAYLCCFVFGAQFAGPYYTPYMLRELGFSYHAFMLVVATGFLVKALLLPPLGRLASRIGSVRLLGIAGCTLAPITLLWIPFTNVGYLVGVQTFANIFWAAYELAVALLFFDIVGQRERMGVVTIYNLGLAVATVAGASCGGLLLRFMGEDRTAYAAVFATSCLLRLVALPILYRLRRHIHASDRAAGGNASTVPT
jgi:MFS family permease